MVIEESGMQFEFPDNRTTVKFDEELFYRNCFNKFPESKGVDSQRYNTLALFIGFFISGQKSDN